MSIVEVPLTQGFVAIIDAADADAVLAYKWCVRRTSHNTYAHRGTHRADGRLIRANGPQRFLGYYATAEEGARAYDAAARELHGEYAALNFPERGERAA